MGSPITTWENAQAYFTGAGGFTPTLFLFLAVAAVVVALVVGHRHESHSYTEVDK